MASPARRIPPPSVALDFAEKNFDPAAVERELYAWWEASGFFTPAEGDDRPPFVMMLPLPNVTGDLHLGHALGFGGYEDLMARWHRMRGEPTLWLPGSDHAGIIAQLVVEKELAKNGASRHGLSRDAFLAEMWKWMAHYQPRIYEQLRRLGCSLDWSRLHFTMDQDMQRRVRIHFIRLFRSGHVYRADRIVHWCLTCQTTYSDLEAAHLERTDPLYHVRYPWAEPMPEGTPDLVVATTRPETIVADVAIAVHPGDERWVALVGKEVLVPVAERRVRIIADDAVDPSFGTGALKVTPGHDQTDFEIGQRHALPVISVIDKQGNMTPAAGVLAGPGRNAARAEMADRLRRSGLLLKEEPLVHSVGVHERCGTIDEPLVMKQWWMRMPPLAAPAIAAVRAGRIRIVPPKFEKVYFNWMENIRDWTISRQIWWGHSIPVWYCRDCDEVIVPEEDGPDPVRCTRCRSDDLVHDPDVLDTWFSSALWPHSTLGWPVRTPDLERFYPGSVLETGYDILFFWVARMIMMGLLNMGDVPFHTVYLHGLVRVGGEKMSKSKGNVTAPMEMVEEYGADALRFALVTGVAAGADQQFSEGRLQNARYFANKLWNVGRFTLRALAASDGAPVRAEVSPWGGPADVDLLRGDSRASRDLGDADRWILSRTEATVAEATRLIEAYMFGEYTALIQQFVWGELADVYLELAKPALRDPSRAAATRRTLAYVLDRVLRLAHPIMPFITETLALQLWRVAPPADDVPSLVIAPWPVPGERDAALEDHFALVSDVVRAIRNARQQAGVGPSARVRAALAGHAERLRPSAGAIGALTNADVTFGEGEGAATVVRTVEVRIAVPRDHGEEHARLSRELAEARTALGRSRDLLARPGFAGNAPPDVVARERSRLEEREERVRLLEAELDRN
ncbi:MAG: valine--tRNA ligase [Candidatus Limnocylindria bacterium]